MQFSATILAAVLAVTASAAPALDARAIPNWTITNMKRVCNAANNNCQWTFGINTNTGTVQACNFAVTGADASEGDATAPTACGVFTVTAGWSGQFGPGNGFTTLALVNTANHQIAYPSYTDKQLANGAVVKPDLSWAVTQM